MVHMSLVFSCFGSSCLHFSSCPVSLVRTIPRFCLSASLQILDEPSAQTGTHRSPFIFIAWRSRRLFIQPTRQSLLPFYLSSATPSSSYQHFLSSIQATKLKSPWPNASAHPSLPPSLLPARNRVPTELRGPAPFRAQIHPLNPFKPYSCYYIQFRILLRKLLAAHAFATECKF